MQIAIQMYFFVKFERFPARRAASGMSRKHNCFNRLTRLGNSQADTPGKIKKEGNP